MTRRPLLLPFAIAALAIVYLLVIGGTYTGIVTPRLSTFTLIGAAILWIGWAIMRARGHWRWVPVPLQAAALLWAIAFTVSLIANGDSWRRIAIGLTYMATYAVVWAALHDFIANRALRREALLDALLIGSTVVMLIGGLQVVNTIRAGAPLPRPGSTLGNPNALAGLIVLWLPLIIGRAWTQRGVARLLLMVLAIAASSLLALTQSRAAWIAAAVGMLALGGLFIVDRGGFSWLRARWRDQSLPVRALMGIAGIAALLATMAGGIWLASTFSQQGRGTDTRQYIYHSAWQAFAAHPIAGSGLFTFGRALNEWNSLPPFEPHSHAHNLVLHVAAELGVIGLIALAGSLLLLARAVIQAYRARVSSERRLIMAGAASIVGLIAHHLFDMPIMVPAVAVVTLGVLAIATATPVVPSADEPLAKPRAWPPRLAFALFPVCIALAGASVWLQTRYVAILSEAGARGDYANAAAQLDDLISIDPRFPIYPYQQGLLYALAADADPSRESEYAAAGAQAFERFTQLEPVYASGWVNLAAMYETIDDVASAIGAMERAAALAPLEPTFHYHLGLYRERAGDSDGARLAYLALSTLNLNYPLLPDWCDSTLRCELVGEMPPLDGAGVTIQRYTAGDRSGARTAWNTTVVRPEVAAHHAISALLALADGDHEAARRELDIGRAARLYKSDDAWLAYVEAAIAADIGVCDLAAERYQAAMSAQTRGAFESDWLFGENIAYIQFLSLAIPRQFAPQVGYPFPEPLIAHLLGAAPPTCR